MLYMSLIYTMYVHIKKMFLRSPWKYSPWLNRYNYPSMSVTSTIGCVRSTPTMGCCALVCVPVCTYTYMYDINYVIHLLVQGLLRE